MARSILHSASIKELPLRKLGMELMAVLILCLITVLDGCSGTNSHECRGEIIDNLNVGLVDGTMSIVEGSMSKKANEDTTFSVASGCAHLTKVVGVVEEVFPFSNSIEVSIISDVSGFFNIERDTFFCDEMFCDVSLFGKGDQVVLECVVPNDSEGRRRASRLYALE